MRIKSPRRGPGISRNLKVMVKSHVVSVDMIKIIKNKFMLLQIV